MAVMNAQAVFDACRGRLRDRAADLARILKTEYSFEVWWNWESYLACQAIWPMTHPCPTYDGKRGDLRVCENGCADVLVEQKTLHSGIIDRDKWCQEFREDVVKLKRIPPTAEGWLYLLFASVKSDPRKDKGWQEWRESIEAVTSCLCRHKEAFVPFEYGGAWLRCWKC